MDYTQSNTKRGPIMRLANSDLTGMEGRMVKIVNDGGVAKADLPAGVTEVTPYVLAEGAAAGAEVKLIPLESGAQVRVVLNGTNVVPGDKIVAYAGGQAGKATKYASGAAFVIGIAEQVGDTDGQYLLIRPLPIYLAA